MPIIKRGDLAPSRHYSGILGKHYAVTHHSDLNSIAWDIEFAHFRPYLDKTDAVLDFGCANGGMLLRVSRHVAAAHGLEVNMASREVAQANGFRVFASLSEIPSEQRYEKIITNHVLEHVRDVCSTLEAIRGIIQLGGLLVAKLPINNIREPNQRTWSEDDKDWHLHTWTPRLFANLLQEAGYAVRREQDNYSSVAQLNPAALQVWFGFVCMLGVCGAQGLEAVTGRRTEHVTEGLDRALKIKSHALPNRRSRIRTIDLPRAHGCRILTTFLLGRERSLIHPERT